VLSVLDCSESKGLILPLRLSTEPLLPKTSGASVSARASSSTFYIRRGQFCLRLRSRSAMPLGAVACSLVRPLYLRPIEHSQ